MSSISNEMMRTSSLRPYQTEAPDRGAHPGVPWFVWEAEFAADSPLEETGFELMVPGHHAASHSSFSAGADSFSSGR
jgi:hypothetical protein